MSVPCIADVYGPPVDAASLAPPLAARPSGGERRKRGNALPQVFIAVQQDQLLGRVATVALLITDIMFVAGSGTYVAMLGGVAALASAFIFAAGSSKAFSVVYALAPADEQRIRASESATGDSVNSHFREFAAVRWRAIKLPARYQDIHRASEPPSFIEIEEKYLKALGVDARQINDISEVVLACVLPEVPPAVPMSSSGSGGGARDAVAAPASSLAAANIAAANVNSMSHERGAGAAAHTYDPAALIQCLLMKAKLKPGVSLQEGLATVAPLFFGQLSAGGLVGELRDGSIQLPQDSVLQDAQIRLDILDLAWERSRCHKFEFWRYGAIDASSAFGNSWFLAREDIFEFSLDAFAPCRGDVPLPSDLNASLKNRMLPMSTLGRGRASLIKKSFNYLNLLRMESPSEDAFVGRCKQVYGIVADQGTEKGVADISTMRDSEEVDASNLEKTQRAFPHAMWMPEHLHIFNNALESAITQLSVWRGFMPQLRAVERFLQDYSLRMLFRATCLSEVREISQMFANYSGSHIEWRWEYLEKSLDKLIPLLGHMKTHLNVEAILKSDEGNIDPAVVKEARGALDTPFFTEFCELVWSLGHTVYMFTHILDGVHLPCLRVDRQRQLQDEGEADVR